MSYNIDDALSVAATIRCEYSTAVFSLPLFTAVTGSEVVLGPAYQVPQSGEVTWEVTFQNLIVSNTNALL